MNPSDDMDAPVTRRELREELQQLEARLDVKIDAKLERFRKEIDEAFRNHVNVVIESQRREIGVLDAAAASRPS